MPSNAIKTDSGIPVKRVHKKKDSSKIRYVLSMQANFRIHCGLYPNMYRERLWTMRIGHDWETNNKYLNFCLGTRQTGLLLGF